MESKGAYYVMCPHKVTPSPIIHLLRIWCLPLFALPGTAHASILVTLYNLGLLNLKIKSGNAERFKQGKRLDCYKY